MKSMKGIGGGGGRKFSMIPFVERKNIDNDEDLVLFRELNKREKDRFASLLQPVSDEFEPNAGTSVFIKILNYMIYIFFPFVIKKGYLI